MQFYLLKNVTFTKIISATNENKHCLTLLQHILMPTISTKAPNLQYFVFFFNLTGCYFKFCFLIINHKIIDSEIIKQ